MGGYFAIVLVGTAILISVYVALLWVSPVDFFSEPGTVTVRSALIEALLMVIVMWPGGAVYSVYSVLFYRLMLGE